MILKSLNGAPWYDITCNNCNSELTVHVSDVASYTTDSHNWIDCQFICMVCNEAFDYSISCDAWKRALTVLHRTANK